MATDLPKLEWEPSEFGGWDAHLGLLSLHVECDPIGWQAHWGDDEMKLGLADTAEDAKDMAVACAEEMLEEALATLRRKR